MPGTSTERRAVPTILSPPSRWRSCRCWRGWSWFGSSRGKALTDFGTRSIAPPASVPETDTAIRLRAAGGSSRRAPEPWCGHGPAWQSTWNERAASLDSAYPQPDGERIVTWPPSRDWRQVPTFPPSPQDSLEQGQFELATRHRLEEVGSSTPGRCFRVSFSCCRTTLDSLVSVLGLQLWKNGLYTTITSMCET